MHVLITGGAGFIGSSLARHLLAQGHTVTLLDNHSRDQLLGGKPPARGARPVQDRWRGLERTARCIDGDITSAPTLLARVPRIDAAVHCAGQVGIAASLADPAEDARNNITGTIQLLETLRARRENIPFVFFSSNKVYGDAVNGFVETGPGAGSPSGTTRLGLKAPWEAGISEQFPAAMDGLTPYGCAKRSGELYVLDAARREQFLAYILRCSCIYGPAQSGAEDQGWVSHVVRSRVAGETIRVFGDGRQTRDLLHVDDLAALVAALVPGTVPGGVYNVGGGRAFSRSLAEVVRHEVFDHGALKGTPPPVLETHPERLFDQRCYYTDLAKITAATGWVPQIGPGTGIPQLAQEAAQALKAAQKRPALRVV